jgi:hypothetical protein
MMLKNSNLQNVFDFNEPKKSYAYPNNDILHKIKLSYYKVLGVDIGQKFSSIFFYVNIERF